MKPSYIAIIMFFIFVSTVMYAQDGDISRNYIMNTNEKGNNVTLSFANGNIISITLSKRLNYQGSDSNIICFYNTSNKNKNLQREILSFSEKLKKIKQKFLEWDSVADANHITEFSKTFPDNNNNIKLHLDYTIIEKGKKYYSYDNNQLGWIKSAGDCCLPLVAYYSITPESKLINFGWELPSRIYVGSTQEPVLGGSYDTYKYYTTTTYFVFFSPQELQTFIDALDIESAKRILLERNKNEQKVDDIFK